MLKSISLENFFSFREKTTIHLNDGVNVLVGINGSGKSNFIKAIRLLYEGVAGIGFEKVFLQEWGGFGSVANFNGQQSNEIKLVLVFNQNVFDSVYEISINKISYTNYYLSEHLYKINKNGEKLSLLETKNGNAKILDVRSNEHEIYSVNPNELAINKTDEYLEHFLEGLSEFRVYSYFDTSFNSSIRLPSNYSIEWRLQPYGKNLTQLLNKIKNYHSLEYETIEKLIKNVNPNFKDIGFDILGSKLYLVLREKGLGKAVGIEHISDGTLRFLLLLSILYNSERGTVVCLDEPEMGLHPDMINTICEGIKHASKKTQMIIATHSPLLLNAFDLSDILIFEKNSANETDVIQKDESDFEDMEDELLPGQLWLMGKLGGKRW